MEKRRLSTFLAASIGLLAVVILNSFALAADIPRMTKDELKAKLGNPEVVILDVRSPSDWDKSDLKIKGAVREDPADAKAWLGNYQKDKTYVLYCA
jgi:hypothetical protein